MNEEVVRWRESKGVFRNKFLFAAWNIGSAFGAAWLVKGCEYWDEMALCDVEKVKMAACVVGRMRDCVLESLWVFLCLVERRALVSIKVAQWWNGSLACRERDYASDRHSKFWGDIKLSLCEACWLHLIYIQLGFLVRNP